MSGALEGARTADAAAPAPAPLAGTNTVRATYGGATGGPPGAASGADSPTESGAFDATPAANTDARVVKVQAALTPGSSIIAQKYTNLQMIARITTRPVP